MNMFPIYRHPTTSSSIAEILSVLFFNTMRYKITEPRDPSSDRLVLSKGHAAPALYGAWVENGFIPTSELKKFRQLGSDLEGHPTPRLGFVDVGTGSLGQGLAIANGMAYVGKYIDKTDYKYVLNKLICILVVNSIYAHSLEGGFKKRSL